MLIYVKEEANVLIYVINSIFFNVYDAVVMEDSPIM